MPLAKYLSDGPLEAFGDAFFDPTEDGGGTGIGKSCRANRPVWPDSGLPVPCPAEAAMTPALLGIQPIRAGGTTIQPEVLASIQQASASTGVDFSYLMAQASRESSF